jgi:hypothetical protein
MTRKENSMMCWILSIDRLMLGKEKQTTMTKSSPRYAAGADREMITGKCYAAPNAESLPRQWCIEQVEKT